MTIGQKILTSCCLATIITVLSVGIFVTDKEKISEYKVIKYVITDNAIINTNTLDTLTESEYNEVKHKLDFYYWQKHVEKVELEMENFIDKHK